MLLIDAILLRYLLNESLKEYLHDSARFREYLGHSAHVTCVRFSADKSRYASACRMLRVTDDKWQPTSELLF
jgi:hypothetical protein